MKLYVLLRRLLILFPTALAGILLVFVSMRVLPGDPVLMILGDAYTPEAYEALTTRLGLDQPLHVQFYQYISGVLQGDLGRTLHTNVPIASVLRRSLPYTLELAAAILVIGAIGGGMLGAWSAASSKPFVREGVRVVYLLGVSIPPFLLCILAILLFSLHFGWFPVYGAGTTLTERIHYLILPAVAGAAPLAAIMAGVLRSYMVEILRTDYIRTARAKGLGEGSIVFVHALRNALIPLITVLANAVPVILAEVVLIERVFNRPGIGKVLVDSMVTRDYPVVQSTMVLVILVVLTVNFLVDIVFTLVNPRIRYS